MSHGAGPVLAPATRAAELDRLLGSIAREPDNDAHRLVLVDLLLDLGEPYGTWLAGERGGGRAATSPSERRATLGPLAPYLEAVKYRGGLPWSASLARSPPDDPVHVAAAAGDLRLGLLSSLRVRRGPLAIYRSLIGSPRAIGLRRVDASDGETLAALIAGGRDELTHLHDVRFSKPKVVGLLAHPTFDRVQEIDTIVQRDHLEGLLARIIADDHGFFARAKRSVVLLGRFAADREAMWSAFGRWRELPLSALTVDGITVSRADGVTRASVARGLSRVDVWRWSMAIDRAGAGPEVVAAIHAALPAE